MLDNDKLKPKKKHKSNDNGSFESQVLESLTAISLKLREHDEQIAEVTTTSKKDEAVLRLVNFLYDPDDRHLPGLTRLPLRAVKPFALAMTLDSILDDDVLSGERSLQKEFNSKYFYLMRSVGAEAFKQGIGLAGEQQAAEAEERGAEFGMGKE